MSTQQFWRTFVWKTSKCSRFFATRKEQSIHEYVSTEEIGDKGVLILNRPKVMNALNVEMIKKLFETIEKWSDTKSMIIVKSNVENVFCAGGDVAAVVGADTLDYGRTNFRTGYALNYMISNLQIPYIAFINGVTIGGGVGLSVNGKFRIATKHTIFMMPEATIGNQTSKFIVITHLKLIKLRIISR